MTTRDVFLAAFALIERAGQWTAGASARDADGVPISARSVRARCWCSIGALLVAPARSTERRAVMCALADEQHPLTAMGWLMDFNDAEHRTHSEVIAHWRATGERMGWMEPQA